ncbi:MAG: hypothetical protein ACI4DU_10190 [Lachnospiraceae bacterium]
MEDREFKYIIQDFTSFQLGSRFTYTDILENDRVPFKFQSIVRLYLLKETSAEMMLGEHLLSMTDRDFSYEVYRQLRPKVKFYVPGKNGERFEQRVLKFVDFIQYKEENWNEKCMIHDISISNLALMTYTI